MKLDQIVSVYCTDLDKTAEGVVVRLERERITVDLSGLLLKFNQLKPGVYAANHSGMEFILKT